MIPVKKHKPVEILLILLINTLTMQGGSPRSTSMRNSRQGRI